MSCCFCVCILIGENSDEFSAEIHTDVSYPGMITSSLGVTSNLLSCHEGQVLLLWMLRHASSAHRWIPSSSSSQQKRSFTSSVF